LALHALAQGDHVTGTVRQIAQCTAFAALAPGRAEAVALDVADEARVDRVVPDIAARKAVDILVNNAGQSIFGPLEDTPAEEARRIFDTNFFGTLAVTRALLPHLRARRAGHVINLSSGCGLAGMAGLAIYSASKFAIEGLSEALAGEVAAFGVKVTLVEPGAVRSNFISRGTQELKRMSDDYKPLFGQGKAVFAPYYEHYSSSAEDVAAAIGVIAARANPPLHLLVGAAMVTAERERLSQRLQDIETWQPITTGTAQRESV
jgi:short-subunit dehydrogenase